MHQKLLSEYYSDILNGTRRVLRDEFIYTSNNDEQYSNGFYYSTRADDVLEGGERVSMASYGLNHYQHLHKAAFLGCANLDGTTIGHWRTYCELNGWDWRELEEKRQAALNYERFINSFPAVRSVSGTAINRFILFLMSVVLNTSNNTIFMTL